MVNPDLRELLKNHSRRYSLVMATAKRAREIVDEANEKGDIIIEKPVSIAINELQNGTLSFKEPEILDDIFDNMEFGKKNEVIESSEALEDTAESFEKETEVEEGDPEIHE